MMAESSAERQPLFAIVEDAATLQAWIGGRLTSASDEMQTLSEIVVALARNDVVVALLRALTADYRWLREAAAKSYVHENGFYKLVLVTSDSPQFKLRLHVWKPSRSGQTIENVHNHRWNFGTVLLEGGYTFEEFAAAADGVGYQQYRYRSPEGGDTYAMEHIAVSPIRKLTRMLLGVGAHYVLDHTVLHRVIADSNNPPVTLMLQGEVRKTSTDVYSFAPIGDAESISAAAMVPAELRELMQHVLLTRQQQTHSGA